PTDDRELNRVLGEDFNLLAQGVADFRVYVPASGTSDADAPARFKVPIAALDVNIIGDILEFTEPQYRMFAKITDQAQRQAKQRPSNRQGVFAEASAEAESPPGYNLQDLIDGLDEDKQFPLIRGNPSSSELPTIGTLRSKLIGLGMSQLIDWAATSS